MTTYVSVATIATAIGFAAAPAAADIVYNAAASSHELNANADFGGSDADTLSVPGTVGGRVDADGTGPDGTEYASSYALVNRSETAQAIEVTLSSGVNGTNAYASGVVTSTYSFGVDEAMTYTIAGDLDVYGFTGADVASASIVLMADSTVVLDLDVEVFGDYDFAVAEFDYDLTPGVEYTAALSVNAYGQEDASARAMFSVTPVPEPAAATAGLLALGGLLRRTRRPTR